MYRNNGQNRMNTFFDDMLHNGIQKVWSEAGKIINDGHAPVNIRENDTNYELMLMAPGLTKEAFKVSIEKNVLTISYQPAEAEQGAEDVKWLRKEFTQTAFKRSFTLSEKTNPAAGISAKYQDGILLLSIPKKEQEEPKTQEIVVD